MTMILVMMVVTMMMVLMLLLLILHLLPDNRLSISYFLERKDFLNSLNILSDELGGINQR